MALLFVRHGATSLNAGDKGAPQDQFRGWSTVPLSDQGRKSIAQTANWLKNAKLTRIISSDLPRAAETAHMISQATGVPASVDERLRPLHVGLLTGKDITPELGKMMDQAHEQRDMPLPGGESYNSFVQRYSSILPELLQASQKENIAVVTHHRNLLALPELFYGKKAKTKGPPEPGGVMALTQKGLYPLFDPPAGSSYAEHAVS